MKRLALAFILAAGPALAAEPTVTLTQSELQSLITEQATIAMAKQAVERANHEASAADAKVRAAFAPKPPVETKKP